MRHVLIMLLSAIALNKIIVSATPKNHHPGSWQIGGPVKTTSGVVQGHAASLAPKVSEYLGIPYGKPTTGDLRFAAPVMYVGDGTISGANYSADCPINPAPAPPVPTDSILGKYFQATAQTNHTFSEDCLSVNVWTKPQVGEKKKAVIVWIYDGGFTSGSSNGLGYNGAFLAEEQDVIVVTFNYRENFFGFAAPHGLPNYNFGLLDQRLAVEWVSKNIEVFGGDPARILLSGQSAGGVSVDIYSYAWTEDPIVNAFIPESGGVGVLTTGDTTSSDMWFNVSQALGCGGPTVADLSVACMRTKSVKAILGAVAIAGDFTPVVDNVTIFSDYEARGKAGKFVRRPVLVGNNNNEAGLFNAAVGGQIPPAVQAMMNLQFTCPAANAALVRRLNNVEVYRYRYFGVWPNLEISSDAGAFHSAEVPLIFGNAALITGIADTPAQSELGKLMRNAWASFAKDPELALSMLGWPIYNPKGNTLIELGYNDTATPIFVNSTQFDGGC